MGKKKTCCSERSKALPNRPYGKGKPQRIYVIYNIQCLFTENSVLQLERTVGRCCIGK